MPFLELLKPITGLSTSKWRNKSHTPQLDTQRRPIWADMHTILGDQWTEGFFSDDKIWNLDGPGECKFYSYGLRKEERVNVSQRYMLFSAQNQWAWICNIEI